MAKVVSIRERVHQPFYDTLIRTAGTTGGVLPDTVSLFTSNGARTEATTNLINGATLPSDQSHVTLALRVFQWFRNPILRVDGGQAGEVAVNGDYGSLTPFLVGGSSVGQAPASVQDVYRLHWQVAEGVHWSFGTGLKNSIDNIPTWYFPSGGGLSGDMGGTTDLIHWQNSGWSNHEGVALLARAILLPPRQNILCQAKLFSYPIDGAQQQSFQTNQGARNMYSVRDNLNAPDLMSKCVVFMFDGLFSRDVQ